MVDSRMYDAYGQEAARLPSGASFAPTDGYGFNARWGYVCDREVGTYYCQSRNYAPNLARWLERDPIGFAGGMNQYAYCAGQPVGNADPSGRLALTALTIGLGTGVLGALGVGITAAGLGAAAGAAADEATGGAYGKFWCRILHVDCEGDDYLPASPRRRSRPRKKIVLGQNMRRVEAAAAVCGAETYDGFLGFAHHRQGGWGHNEAWLRDKVNRGYDIYDIGWDTLMARGGSYADEDKWLKAHGNPRRFPMYWPPLGRG